MKKSEVVMLLALVSGGGYANAAVGSADIEQGEQAWIRAAEIKGEQRSCTSCHGSDLSGPGKHKRTGKRIEPMALSANPKRYQDPKKVEKWFKRNCKWTWGRECTLAEKKAFLAFLRNR